MQSRIRITSHSAHPSDPREGSHDAVRGPAPHQHFIRGRAPTYGETSPERARARERVRVRVRMRVRVRSVRLGRFSHARVMAEGHCRSRHCRQVSWVGCERRAMGDAPNANANTNANASADAYSTPHALFLPPCPLRHVR